MKLTLLPGEKIKLTQKQYAAMPFSYTIIAVALLFAPLVYFGFDFVYLWFYRLYALAVIGFFLRKIIMYAKTILIITTNRIIIKVGQGFIFSRTTEIELQKVANISSSYYAPFMPQLEIFPLGTTQPLVLRHFHEVEKIKNLIWYLKGQ